MSVRIWVIHPNYGIYLYLGVSVFDGKVVKMCKLFVSVSMRHEVINV